MGHPPIPVMVYSNLDRYKLPHFRKVKERRTKTAKIWRGLAVNVRKGSTLWDNSSTLTWHFCTILPSYTKPSSNRYIVVVRWKCVVKVCAHPAMSINAVSPKDGKWSWIDSIQDRICFDDLFSNFELSWKYCLKRSKQWKSKNLCKTGFSDKLL